jgi:hypothetical protein
LVAEPGHLPDDLQSGVHRAAHVVLVRDRVTEHRQQSIASGRADVALVSVHGAQHLLAIPANEEPIRFGLHPSRQHRRIDQIGEQDRQPPNLTSRTARAEHIIGEQALGISVRAVDGLYLSGERRGTRAVTAVDRGHRLIQ